MKIKSTHERIGTVLVCIYCKRPLQKGLEKKRGSCRVCKIKFDTKEQKKLGEFTK